MRRAWLALSLASLVACAPGEIRGVPEDDVPDAAIAPDLPAPQDVPRATEDLPAATDVPAPDDSPAAMDVHAPPVDRPLADFCAGMPDGPRCVNAPSGAAVITCAQGVTRARAACEAACVEPGMCLTDALEPCFNDADGDYCGASIGATSRQGDLFHCRGRRTASVDPCAHGCDDRAGGSDACRPPPVMPTDPCSRASYGNGAYCGAGIGGDASTLYQCVNRATASSQRCANGCQAQPPGVPDNCAPAPGGRCCLARPPGTFVRGFSACGGGGSHYGVDLGAPLGTELRALIAGTVIGTATGHPNCPYNAATGTCPSSCVNNFNYVKVRADCGDPRDPSRDLLVWYLHVDRLAPGIGNGAHVNAGDLIAYIGNSGCSSGPHLHLEVASVPRGGNSGVNTCTSFNPQSIYC